MDSINHVCIYNNITCVCIVYMYIYVYIIYINPFVCVCVCTYSLHKYSVHMYIPYPLKTPKSKEMAISLGTFKLTNRAGPNVYNSTFDGFMIYFCWCMRPKCVLDSV